MLSDIFFLFDFGFIILNFYYKLSIFPTTRPTICISSGNITSGVYALLSEISSIEKKLSLSKKQYSQIKSKDREILNKLKKANLLVTKFEKIIEQQKGYLK